MIGSPLTVATAADMHALGAQLGCLLRAGDVLALDGPLGAGKTTFAQGLGAGLGVAGDRPITSPTFALACEYPGRTAAFVHADLYRVNNAAELEELGLQDAGERAVIAIEWAQRFPEVLPRDFLLVRITPAAGQARVVSLEAHGPRSEAVARAVTWSAA